MLRAISEMLSPDGTVDAALLSLRAGIKFALGEFRLEPHLVATSLGKLLVPALKKEGVAEAFALTSLDTEFANRVLVRSMLANYPPYVAWVPATWLSARLADRSEAIRRITG